MLIVPSNEVVGEEVQGSVVVVRDGVVSVVTLMTVEGVTVVTLTEMDGEEGKYVVVGYVVLFPEVTE